MLERCFKNAVRESYCKLKLQLQNVDLYRPATPLFKFKSLGPQYLIKLYIFLSEQPIDVFGLVSAYLWGVSAATYLPFVHKDLAPNVFIIIRPPGHCYRRLLSCHSVILHPPPPRCHSGTPILPHRSMHLRVIPSLLFFSFCPLRHLITSPKCHSVTPTITIPPSDPPSQCHSVAPILPHCSMQSSDPLP